MSTYKPPRHSHPHYIKSNKVTELCVLAFSYVRHSNTSIPQSRVCIINETLFHNTRVYIINERIINKALLVTYSTRHVNSTRPAPGGRLAIQGLNTSTILDGKCYILDLIGLISQAVPAAWKSMTKSRLVTKFEWICVIVVPNFKCAFIKVQFILFCSSKKMCILCKNKFRLKTHSDHILSSLGKFSKTT